MSSENQPFVADDSEVLTDTRDARMTGSGEDNRFNSKLREAFGSSPFILTKFDKFMNWVRGSPGVVDVHAAVRDRLL
jgi:NADH-quinone oxidoreductase subunit B